MRQLQLLALSLLSLLMLGCHLDGPRHASDPDQLEQAAPAVHAPEQPGAAPRAPDDPASEPDACDPLPRDRSACHSEGKWCVIDWGEPCGASTAAWCRDGVWIYEEESNLCD